MKLLPLNDRFWAKVKRGLPDECWPWLGTKNAKGYGHFYGSHKWVHAHRFALQITTGKTGEVAMHSCDNPPCCNPSHLKWGTDSENMQDRKRRNPEYMAKNRAQISAVREAYFNSKKLAQPASGGGQ